MAFDIRTARARQLDHNTQSLIGFLDVYLYSADVLLLGGGGVASGLLRETGLDQGQAGEHCEAEDPHFPNFKNCRAGLSCARRMRSAA